MNWYWMRKQEYFLRNLVLNKTFMPCHVAATHYHQPLVIYECLWKISVMKKRVSSWNWLQLGQWKSESIWFCFDSKSYLPSCLSWEFRSQLIYLVKANDSGKTKIAHWIEDKIYPKFSCSSWLRLGMGFLFVPRYQHLGKPSLSDPKVSLLLWLLNIHYHPDSQGY